MKKLFWIFLCIALVFSFAACDLIPGLGDDQGSTNDSSCRHIDNDDDHYCDLCGEAYEDGKDIVDESPKCDHRDVNDDYLCDYCGENYDDGDEHLHIFGDWELVTDPTCVTYGEKIRKCEGCGSNETERIAPYGHSFTEWITVQSGGCADVEYNARFCKICEFFEVDADASADLVHPHTFIRIQRVATCTEDGYTYKFECVNCHFVAAEEIIPATGHDFANNTYTSAGNTQHYLDCLNCGKVYSAHSIEAWETVQEPTCYDFGIIRGTCDVCNASIDKKLDKTHTFAVSEHLVYPSCDTEGVALCYCTSCGVSQEINIGYKHNTVHNMGSAATCTKDGHIEYWFCDECNAYFSSVIHVSSMNIYHDEAYYNVAVDAYSYTVVSAGDIRIPAMEHNYGSSYNAYNTTQHWQRCVNGCGNETSRIPHDITEDFNVEMQETDKGYLYIITYRLYCEDCDYCVEKIFRNALTESHDSYVVKEGVAPTCTADGYTASLICGECDEVLCSADVIPATGHNFVKQVCVNCGAVQKSEGLRFSLDDSGEYYIVSGIGGCKDLDIIIPPMYNDLPVKAIGSSAFANNSNITSVTIPDSITSIGEGAFNHCSSLKNVYISDLTAWCNITFGNYYSTPLYYAKNLYLNGELITNLVIPDSTTSISNYAFYNYANLTGLLIPDDVTYIGDYAFYNCDCLTSVVILDSVTFIGAYAFYSCESLTKIVVGSNVSSVGYHAFEGCSALYVVENNSDISLVIGSTSNGYLTKYAKLLIDKNGNKTYSSTSYVDTPDGLLFEKTYSGTYLIAYFGNEETLTLPIDFDGSSYAIRRMRGVKNVIIPEGFTNIGSNSFEDCLTLTSIVLPKTLTTIDHSAFNNCIHLEIITIRYGITTIGNNAFLGCSSLTSITIPDSVTSIGEEAFYNCSGLVSVVIGSGVTAISNSAFRNCVALENIILPDYITKIDHFSFMGCNSLVSINIPEGVTDIGNCAFSGCSALISITIPESVTAIGTRPFEDCTALEEIRFNAIALKDLSSTAYIFTNAGKNGNGIKVIIGKNVTKIPAEIFMSYSTSPKIVSVEFEEGSVCKSIGNSAFYHCSNLTSIVIPDSVTSIGYSAFSGCSSLASVVIPNSVTSISDYAFYYCSNLTSIVIPDSVTSIGIRTFNNCTSLTDVVIGDGVTVIGYEAFQFCTNLTNVVIGNSVTEIGEYAFNNCDSLKSIVIPDSVTTIKIGAFTYCDKLTSVTLGSNCAANVSDSAFDNCNSALYTEYECGKYVGDSTNPYQILIGLTDVNLTAFTIHNDTQLIAGKSLSDGRFTSITIPDNVKAIGSNAFSYNRIITNITLGNGVIHIFSSAFYCCSNLASIVIPDSVTSIGDSAFSDCSSLASVVIGNSVTSINSSLFSYCTNITSIVIPNNVTSIGDYAFSHCENLTSIVIPNNVTSIGDYAFSHCENLTSIVIPNSVTSIGDYTFYGCYSISDIYYTGSKEDWAKIRIGGDNYSLNHVTIHYNYLEEAIADKA